MKAVDCQSFAGGFALGVVQAGFELVAKREYPGAFGVAAMEANRHLLGTSWETESADPETWTPVKADLVFGNPPCSGFSQRSAVRGKLDDGSMGWVKFRGIDSEANKCMWALIEYAAKCDPEIVVFESVQGAFRTGRSLMQDLRARLEELTDTEWNLHHVLHNVADLGGAQVRPRYFWVASRIPFGIRISEPIVRATVRDRIGSLSDIPLDSLDGHVIDDSAQERRIHDFASTGEWGEDEMSGDVIRRVEETGSTFESWNGPFVTDRGTTQFAPRHLAWDKPSRVLTGDAPWKIVHPEHPRTLTHREIATLTGFPVEWTCEPYTRKKANSYWWGKGICVEAGQWIATQAYNALEGSPGEYSGEDIGDREFLIDASKISVDVFDRLY